MSLSRAFGWPWFRPRPITLAHRAQAAADAHEAARKAHARSRHLERAHVKATCARLAAELGKRWPA